jgi:Ca2+/Na+ antiporter
MTERVVIWREVIRPPLWLLAFIYFMFLSIVLAIWAAFDNQIALMALVAVTILLLYIALTMKRVITLDDQELRIGRAHIELKYLDTVTLLTPAEIRLLRTRDADPAAFPALIFWVSTGVKITLKDPRDSTPYWLVSSKKSEELTNTLYKLL